MWMIARKKDKEGEEKEGEEKDECTVLSRSASSVKLQLFLAASFSSRLRGQLTPRRLFDPASNKAHLGLFREIASSSFRTSRFPLLRLLNYLSASSRSSRH